MFPRGISKAWRSFHLGGQCFSQWQDDVVEGATLSGLGGVVDPG